MDGLIKDIYNHKNSNNSKICFTIMDYIHKRNINSVAELKKNEDDYFTPVDSNIKPSDKEILDKVYKVYDNDYDFYMELSDDDKTKIDLLNKEYLKENDLDKKYIIIIKMYAILDWDLILPYHAYKYILEDRLK